MCVDRYRHSVRRHEWLERSTDCSPAGWQNDGNSKIDALIRVVREAAAHSGNVTDATWKAAQQAGRSNAQLAEAFA
jgi:hypothetical protein